MLLSHVSCLSLLVVALMFFSSWALDCQASSGCQGRLVGLLSGLCSWEPWHPRSDRGFPVFPSRWKGFYNKSFTGFTLVDTFLKASTTRGSALEFGLRVPKNSGGGHRAPAAAVNLLARWELQRTEWSMGLYSGLFFALPTVFFKKDFQDLWEEFSNSFGSFSIGFGSFAMDPRVLGAAYGVVVALKSSENLMIRCLFVFSKDEWNFEWSLCLLDLLKIRKQHLGALTKPIAPFVGGSWGGSGAAADVHTLRMVLNVRSPGSA